MEDIKRHLEELSYNLWWTWNPVAKSLFRSIDPLLWEEVNENPIKLLKESKRLGKVLQSPEFQKHYKYVYTLFKHYLERHSVYEDIYKKPIVFFSPEYGLHHSHRVRFWKKG